MLYADIDAGAGGRDLFLEFVMHFSNERFFRLPSIVVVGTILQSAIYSFFFSTNGAPAEVS